MTDSQLQAEVPSPAREMSRTDMQPLVGEPASTSAGLPSSRPAASSGSTELAGIVVPLDGSAESSRAVPLVRSLAAALGIDTTILVPRVDGVDRSARGSAEHATALASAEAGRIICVAVPRRGRLRRAARRTVATHLLADRAVPLLLVGPGCDPDALLDRPGPILYFDDGSESSEASLAVGAEWAERLDRDLALQTVIAPTDDFAPGELEARLDRVRDRVDATGRMVDCLQLVRASAADVVVEYADGEQCPLIVLASEKASMGRRLLLGDVVLDVVRHAPCPVLVLPERRRVGEVA